MKMVDVDDLFISTEVGIYIAPWNLLKNDDLFLDGEDYQVLFMHISLPWSLYQAQVLW